MPPHVTQPLKHDCAFAEVSCDFRQTISSPDRSSFFSSSCFWPTGEPHKKPHSYIIMIILISSSTSFYMAGRSFSLLLSPLSWNIKTENQPQAFENYIFQKRVTTLVKWCVISTVSRILLLFVFDVFCMICASKITLGFVQRCSCSVTPPATGKRSLMIMALGA